MNKADVTLLIVASGETLPATIMLLLIAVPELIQKVVSLDPSILRYGLFPQDTLIQLDHP